MIARRLGFEWAWMAAAAFAIGSAEPSRSATFMFTDQAAFEASASAIVSGVVFEEFAFTSANLGLATEVAVPPSTDSDLGPSLTLADSATGLGLDFQLTSQQAGASFIFDDAVGNPGFFQPNVLSVGRVNSFEDDDWEVAFSPGIRAFGFLLVNNDFNTMETVQVFGEGGLLLDTVVPPADSTGANFFVGITSTESILRIAFDEDIGEDDIGLSAFFFGAPEPGSAALLVSAGCALWLLLRRAWS